MAEGKCASCSRVLLIGFNFVFWILGVVFIGIGIWLVAGDNSSEVLGEEIHVKLPQESLDLVAYIIIAVGTFMFIVGFCGCCGAIRESACMLGTYVLLIAILLCGEIAAIIYVVLEKSTLEQMVRDQLRADVRNYTGESNDTGIDFMQTKFGCCGSDNFTDYQNSYYFMNGDHPKDVYVPFSCCRQDGDPYQCQMDAKDMILNGTHLYTRGCFVLLKNLIDDNGAIVIGVAAAVAVADILGLIFAVCLCRNRTYYYD